MVERSVTATSRFSRAIHRQRRRVLDLDPVRASAATIGAISPLRDQAFQFHLASGAE
jgi:hypothetical protein